MRNLIIGTILLAATTGAVADVMQFRKVDYLQVTTKGQRRAGGKEARRAA